MLVEQDIVIRCADGLHARPAAALVKLASGYKGTITLFGKDKCVDAKSILGILSAGLGCGNQVRVSVEGENATAMMQAIVELLSGGND